MIIVVGLAAEGCRRLCEAREGCGGGSFEGTVVDLVDLGGAASNAGVGGAGPDAGGGGVTPNADAGGVGPNAEVGGVAPNPDAEGATEDAEGSREWRTEDLRGCQSGSCGRSVGSRSDR